MTFHNKINLQNALIDAERFDKKLSEETKLLETWFVDKKFSEDDLQVGSEIEFFLLDKDFNPLPSNLAFIQRVNLPEIICEVGKAQLEINSKHFQCVDHCFTKLHENILNVWQTAWDAARKEKAYLALIGSLPTTSKYYYEKQYITEKPRYEVINQIMEKARKNNPISLRLEGEEDLNLSLNSIALNGLLSAFQVHIQVGLSQSVRYYNLAQIIAAPLMAISSNSPFLFGHALWDETRIGAFEQIMSLPSFDTGNNFQCCCFGNHYLTDSFFELFKENFQFFPRLLPEVLVNNPPQQFFHVRRQNGVVYRWNRPVIDFSKENQNPHLRIEHRSPSSGPTIVDMIANAAFFYGLLAYFGTETTALDRLIPFHVIRNNFYNAAKFGLHASFEWCFQKKVPAYQLIETLIPLAKKGLQISGVHRNDIEHYLEIIARRNEFQLTGSQWQRTFIKKHGKNFKAMLACYIQNQAKDLPISEWKC